jgi:ABC-type transport system involved in multi-copper enzyme maturation permease subunit
MRFLSVADRELRSAARQKATYRARWITAALFLALLAWLLWVFQAFRNQWAVLQVFKVFSVLAFLYCLFLSAARTADCISVERREGTLGLLFLTNLNSAEIIAGKLCSSALSAVYSLMAIFPMLALPLLMGGVTFGLFGRTVLALLTGMLSALAAGFLASVVCKRQFTAVALALGLTLLLSGGMLLAAASLDSYPPTKFLSSWLAPFSPLYTLLAADTSRVSSPNLFWPSVATITVFSFGCLGLTTFVLARTWRDRPKTVRPWHRLKLGQQTERPPSAKRLALRRRLLTINPVFWLASRQRVSAPVFMVLAVVVTLVTVYVAAPYLGRVMGPGAARPVLGYWFAWLWAGLGLHALVLYYAATTASQRLAEDKQAGALELILSTPTSERTLSRGLWLAYWRNMFFPALLVVLVHVFFIWMLLTFMVLDPPGRMTLNATPGEIFWSALLHQPLKGRFLDWEYAFIIRIPLLVLLLLMLTWPTLGWVGRWLGLRMKHPGFAPMASLALLIIPPVLLFSFACYLADKWHLTRLPDHRFLPLMMWLTFAIGVGHCLALSLWAATRLRHQLRAVAMSRYQPLPRWRWRLPSWRSVRRAALATAGSAALMILLAASYFGYQNWRSQRAWKAFQASLQQKGESLNLAPLLPAHVPNEANFARSPAFLALLSKTNHQATALVERVKPFDLQASGYQGNLVLTEWFHQTNAPLHQFVTGNRQSPRSSSPMTRQEDATAIVQDLEAQSGQLRELAGAATRLTAFQTTSNQDAQAVFRHPWEGLRLLERLHLLFQVRACAALELGRNAEAAEDVLTGFRLAELARQLPDVRSAARVQLLLTHSLQPLWEGLSHHAWNEPQLAAFQHELSGFNLLADYTNAVRRVVLAHIEVWREFPDRAHSKLPVPEAYGTYLRDPVWRLQPRAWWLESCMQLHSISHDLLEQVDVGAGRVQRDLNWQDLNGLPVDSPSRDLLQPPLWWNSNPASVAFTQTAVNQATLACALERFRLAHRVYPDTLDPLVPVLLARIPHDAVSGRPIIYQALGQDHFILRGVGPDGLDSRKNPASDDWLWAYSTNALSAPQPSSGSPKSPAPRPRKAPPPR